MELKITASVIFHVKGFGQNSASYEYRNTMYMSAFYGVQLIPMGILVHCFMIWSLKARRKILTNCFKPFFYFYAASEQKSDYLI